MLRAVEWLGVEGFDPWVDAAAADLSNGPDSGVDLQSAWYLFHLLRSDLALERAQRPGVETWLWRMSRGSLDEDAPWRQIGWLRDMDPQVDVVSFAAILVFAWERVQPSMDRAVVDRALRLLMDAQLEAGGWPLWVGNDAADLYTTCVVIHALALARPEGWADAASRAAAWIASEQGELGYWYIQGGPTVMLTVLALDAISLGTQARHTTFRFVPTPEPEAVTHGDQSEEPAYDFSEQPWHSPPLPKLISRPRNNLDDKLGLLLVVATRIELAQVLRVLRPPFHKQKIASVHVGTDTFFVGRFGVHTAAVLRCTMGTTGPSGATLSTAAGIRVWQPKAVVMPGVAFGMKREDHRVADLLVAHSIVPYEVQRKGEVTISRGPQPGASPALLNRLRAPDWAFARPDGSVVARHEGAVLRGEKLVDDEEFKAELARLHPAAIGGEMEGAGVYAASARAGLNWALVKGVCDWGDGNKHNGYQEMAAAAAVSLCLHVFQDEYALDGLRRAAPEQ